MFRSIGRWFRRHFQKGRTALIPTPRGESLVEAFFTNAELQTAAFLAMLTSPQPEKQILVLHGIGGVGKSTLLMMFRRICRERKVFGAMASGESAITPIDILEEFASDLKNEELNFRKFQKTLTDYRSIQAKVSSENAKLGAVAADLAKGTVSAIPGIGPMAGKASAPAIDWLRSFLMQPQIDLLLKPEVMLTSAFLADIKQLGSSPKIALMIDTYEHLTGVDSWLCKLAQNLPDNMILVVAGRDFPIENWNRNWPGWVVKSNVLEVRPMERGDMKLLLERYFTAAGEPAPSSAQAEEIVEFARGLPLVVIVIAGLWRQHGLTDFRKVKPQVVADLVDRLMESVPKEIRGLLEAAASLRWFNRELLELVTNSVIADDQYDAVRRFEFIRARAEGPAMHDVIRDIIDENLHTQDPARHRQFHMSARDHFRKLMALNILEDREQMSVEWLYHAFKTDEREGIDSFRETCDRVSELWDLNLLAALLTEANSWTTRLGISKLWTDYYSARLLQSEGDWTQAEQTYKNIAESKEVDNLLRAYALSELGNILTRWERIGEDGGIQKAREVLGQCLLLAPLDEQLADALFRFARIAEYEGKWSEAVDYINRTFQVFEARNDVLGKVRAFNALQAAFVLQGNWHGMRDAEVSAVRLISSLPQQSCLRARTEGYWAWAWLSAGRYAATEQNLLRAISVIQDADNNALPTYLRHLGAVVALQGRWEEGEASLARSVQATEGRGPDFRESWSTSLLTLGILFMRRGAFVRAEEYLSQSLSAKRDIHDNVGIPEVFLWLGELYRLTGRADEADRSYEESLQWSWLGRKHCEGAALLGLCRLAYQTGALVSQSPNLLSADAIAADFEYNDQLAGIKLIQGRVSFDTRDKGESLQRFREAMIYALRFNRFLLDDVIVEIIEICLAGGQVGKELLLGLRDFWEGGSNDTLSEHAGSISLVFGRVRLKVAECDARTREPGDGLPQIPVINRLEQALG